MSALLVMPVYISLSHICSIDSLSLRARCIFTTELFTVLTELTTAPVRALHVFWWRMCSAIRFERQKRAAGKQRMQRYCWMEKKNQTINNKKKNTE